jgi:hypothetical protein
VRALHHCGYRAGAEEVAPVEKQIRTEGAKSAQTWATLVDLGGGEALQLLRGALGEALDQDRERVFYLLSFLCDPQAVLRARDNLALPSAEKRAYAREMIDVLAPPTVKAAVMPLLSDQPANQKLQQVRNLFPQPQRDRRQRLQEILDAPSGRVSAWTQACALYAIGSLGASELTDTVVGTLSAPESVVRETAVWALTRLEGVASRSHVRDMIHDSNPQVVRFAGPWETDGHQEERMLSTVEKVLALKKVDVFAETPDEMLAAVGSLLEEVRQSGGETVFEKDELGDCMYLVFDGEVRVHDGERTLNHLGPGEVFGEMALLDPQPRMASVTAVGDTLLLRLSQEPLYELMDERTEVARGIIRVLCRRLRDRVKDLDRLGQLLDAQKE